MMEHEKSIFGDFTHHVFSTLDIQKADDLNASIGLENEDNLFLWNIVFEGPEDSLYEGGYFKAQL